MSPPLCLSVSHRRGIHHIIYCLIGVMNFQLTQSADLKCTVIQNPDVFCMAEISKKCSTAIMTEGSTYPTETPKVIVDPFQMSRPHDLLGHLHAGVSISVNISESQFVEIAYSAAGEDPQCITMNVKSNTSDVPHEKTLNIDLFLPDEVRHWIVRVRGASGRKANVDTFYTETRVSLQNNEWELVPMNSSLWGTVITYGKEYSSRSVWFKFAAPPSQYRMKSFVVKLKKIVRLPGPPRPFEPRKTVQNFTIHENYYTFRNLPCGRYRVFVKPSPKGCACKLDGGCSRCSETFTDIIEISCDILNAKATDDTFSSTIRNTLTFLPRRYGGLSDDSYLMETHTENSDRKSPIFTENRDLISLSTTGHAEANPASSWLLIILITVACLILILVTMVTINYLYYKGLVNRSISNGKSQTDKDAAMPKYIRDIPLRRMTSATADSGVDLCESKELHPTTRGRLSSPGLPEDDVTSMAVTLGEGISPTPIPIIQTYVTWHVLSCPHNDAFEISPSMNPDVNADLYEFDFSMNGEINHDEISV